MLKLVGIVNHGLTPWRKQRNTKVLLHKLETKSLRMLYRFKTNSTGPTYTMMFSGIVFRTDAQSFLFFYIETVFVVMQFSLDKQTEKTAIGVQNL
ncbi:hypothetical protein AVEN_148085-1 [Araneus ventricosus]|uniref:Uncharacterized protein n=1 Tax=Araneus ventricosus TaxID=182803 RepID=A0A4Y2G5N6_ARAVE|nr:hypothetical protein AVEN_148085-1 [Araneus ventricosus]